MIKFDINLLSVDIVLLKSVTTSLGGSISVINEANSTDKKEVVVRIPVPMATARAFIMATKKVTKYLKPVYCALAKYNGMVIAMERHPLAGLGTLEEESITGAMKRWEPRIEQNIRDIITEANGQRGWYFDGRYMFSFDTPDVATMVANGTDLTADGVFKKINAQTIDLQELHTADKLAISERNCLAITTSLGDIAVSPPIWKDLEGIGNHQIKRAAAEEFEVDEDDGVTITRNIENAFDRIDEMMSVNLNFALKAGQEIGPMFGYEFVEPLQLSRLMIELHTVNLPNLPKQIKATYDTGMRFTHTMAWLLGMTRKANTLETYIMMRSLLSYLTRKGIFRSGAFNASAVYRDGKAAHDVELKDLSSLLGQLDFTEKSLAGIIADAKLGIKAGRRDNDDVFKE